MHRFLGRRFYVSAGATTASVVLLANSESARQDLKFTYHAFRRSSSVVLTLSKCVWEYRTTLNAKYPSEKARDTALSSCHSRCAEITRKAIEQNAGIFIKLGQHINALTYIFPEEWTSAMIPLLDQCPESSYKSIETLFIQDTGKSINDFFSSFDEKPLAAASLAQVHLATLNGSNEKVAVKVQHPSLQQFVPLDIQLTEMIFNLVDYFFPEYPLTWLSQEMRRSIFVELDFREEAMNSEKTRNYFAPYYNKTALRVPIVHWAEKRILCMEYLPGIRPDNTKKLKEEHVNLKKLSTCLANIFNTMIFTKYVGLHCDPHAGNLAIRKCKNRQGFEIVLYDHGLYRYIPSELQLSYARFWLALLDNDLPAMKAAAHDFAGVNDENFKIFAAAITGRDFNEAIDGSFLKKVRSGSEIEHMQQRLQDDSKLTSQIVQMLRRMPPTVLLILKTNDLVRCLDEKLGYPLGATRQFAIMANYCANTVYLEDINRGGKMNWIKSFAKYMIMKVKLAFLPYIEAI